MLPKKFLRMLFNRRMLSWLMMIFHQRKGIQFLKSLLNSQPKSSKIKRQKGRYLRQKHYLLKAEHRKDLQKGKPWGKKKKRREVRQTKVMNSKLLTMILSKKWRKSLTKLTKGLYKRRRKREERCPYQSLSNKAMIKMAT